MLESNKILIFNDVSATYKNGVGIFDISFDLSVGEFVFLMGPTGSGKSTILRSIYMDVGIKRGKVIFSGCDITKTKKREIPYLRRDIGMIFQDYKLLEDRTVFDNVALPLQISGYKSNLIRDRVFSMLDKVSLANKGKQLPSKLSGGERQRVSIARALITEPKLILADEPTGNLDPIVADEILDLLEDTAMHSGASVLMSSHNFPLIQPRKKRFIELSDGRQVDNDI